ncbi:MAG: SprT-like domain-containing protein [Phycisphaerales bacterium]|jgi:predicted SprT family Zn-dependent metalloprotease
MHIPNHITIAGHRVKFEWVEDLSVWGSYHHDRKTIQLNPQLKREDHPQRATTVIHEMAHAVSYLTAAHQSLFGDDDTREEAFARLVELQLAPALIALLGAKPPKR